MKSVFRVLLFLLVFAQVSFAFNFTVRESVVVPLGASEKLTININNSLNMSDNFNIVVSGQKPWMTLSPTVVAVNASSSATASLYLDSNLETPPELYILKMMVESINTGEEKERSIYVSVVKGDITKIEDVIISGDFKPTGNVTVGVRIKNYAKTTIQDVELDVTVKSPSGKIYDISTFVERLDPDKIKTVNKTFFLPQQAEAGSYTVEAELLYGGMLNKKENKFSVAEAAVIEEVSEDIFLIFGSGNKITLTNYGNKQGSREITRNISSFDSIFFSGKPTSISGDTYSWILSIEPGKEKTVEYRIDYLPLFLLFVVLIAAAWFFLYRIRTVTIRKHIIQKKMIEEGEEFTVGLEVKNSSGYRLRDVAVKDLVPPVFSAKDTVGPKPARKTGKMGTELTWKIEDFAQGDERVLTYKIIPMFGVRGQARLPRAAVRFKVKGKPIQNSSTIAVLGIKTEE